MQLVEKVPITQERFTLAQKKQSASYYIHLLRIKFFWFFASARWQRTKRRSCRTKYFSRRPVSSYCAKSPDESFSAIKTDPVHWPLVFYLLFDIRKNC